MTDTIPDPINPLGLPGMPIQPTGSGVTDLEIVREQDALADDGDITGAIEDVTSSPTEDDATSTIAKLSPADVANRIRPEESMMTDDRSQADPSRVGDASGLAAEDIIPPEQPPMDDAAGGPQANASDGPLEEETDNTSVDDLSVQGGE